MEMKDDLMKMAGKDAAMLSKEQLIEILYRTDELMNELTIVRHQIQNKQHVKEVELEALQHEYVEDTLQAYHESDDVLAYEDYRVFAQNVANFKKVALLLAIIIPLIIGNILFFMKVEFILVAGLVVILPFILFFIYQLIANKMVQDKKMPMPQSDEAIRRSATEEGGYEQLEQSLKIRNLGFEVKQLEQKQNQILEVLQTESVLKEIYYEKARRLIYFLNNQFADNLKEALLVLSTEEHRQQMEAAIREHEETITELRTKTNQLQDQVNELQAQVSKQQSQLEQMTSRK